LTAQCKAMNTDRRFFKASFHQDEGGFAPKAGFTLIELMVVMLLITIFLAVALPRLDAGFAQDPTKKVTRWMVNTTRALRTDAVRRQKLQSLVVDLNNNRMWMVNEEMDEEALAGASEKAYTLPSSIRVVDVEYPQADRVSAGTAEIHFYPAGYADNSIIHLEEGHAQRFSILIEPLLPKIKVIEEWLSF
jgi:prepilin-type N-terminal cleavage/methylation domain-containing protein